MRPLFILPGLLFATGCTYDLCDKAVCGSGGAGGTGGSTSDGASTSVGGQGGGTAFEVSIRFVDTEGTPLANRTFLHASPDGETLEVGSLDGSGETSFNATPSDFVTVFDPPSGEEGGHVYSAQVAGGTGTIRFIAQTHTEARPTNGWAMQALCSSCSNLTKAEFSVSGIEPYSQSYSGASNVFHSWPPNTQGVPSEDHANLYMRTYEATGQIERYTSLLDVAKPLAGTIDLPEMTSPAAMTELAWTVSNVPAEYTIRRWMQNFQNSRHGYARKTENQTKTELFRLPTEWVGSPTFFTEVVNPELGHTFRHRKRAPTFVDESQSIDVSSLAFPEALASIDVTDPSRPEYPFAISGALGDAVQVSFKLTSGGATETTWTIVMPAAASGSVRVPVLPTQLESLGGIVPPNDNVVTISQVAIPDGGYAELLDAGVLEGTGDREDLTEITQASTQRQCALPSGC